MCRAFAVAAVLVMLCLTIGAQADVFSLGAGYANLETVAVGDRGNQADTRVMDDGTTGYGSVAYNYRIGKYEVTAKQYTDFLNNKAKCDGDPYGLYNTAMWSDAYGCKIQRSGGGTVANPYLYTVADDLANRPVNFVSFWDTCRFVNWLGNGQGSGDTESGAYTLTTSGIQNNTITRNAVCKWALASEDEWYKAAYYKGKGTNADYWYYPTQNNNLPSNQLVDPDPGNNATFWYQPNGYTIGGPYWRTEVGAHENSDSAYGTFDQAGNVREWTEAIVQGYARDLRGGSFRYYDKIMASGRDWGNPTMEGAIYGFRVVAIPEPSSIVVLAGGFIGLLGIRRRKA